MVAAALQTSVFGTRTKAQVARNRPAQSNTSAATGKLQIARWATTSTGLTGAVSTQYRADTPQIMLAITPSANPVLSCCGEYCKFFAPLGRIVTSHPLTRRSARLHHERSDNGLLIGCTIQSATRGDTLPHQSDAPALLCVVAATTLRPERSSVSHCHWPQQPYQPTIRERSSVHIVAIGNKPSVDWKSRSRAQRMVDCDISRNTARRWPSHPARCLFLLVLGTALTAIDRPLIQCKSCCLEKRSP